MFQTTNIEIKAIKTPLFDCEDLKGPLCLCEIHVYRNMQLILKKDNAHIYEFINRLICLLQDKIICEKPLEEKHLSK